MRTQSRTIKKEASKKVKKSGKKNLARPKNREKVITMSSGSFCAPGVQSELAADDASTDLMSQAKINCALRQMIYLMNFCPTCSTTYTAGMNAPGTEHYFGNFFYKSRYCCDDCHHTFDVDLAWSTDAASSSSDRLTAELLVNEDAKNVKAGSAIDEPV